MRQSLHITTKTNMLPCLTDLNTSVVNARIFSQGFVAGVPTLVTKIRINSEKRTLNAEGFGIGVSN